MTDKILRARLAPLGISVSVAAAGFVLFGAPAPAHAAACGPKVMEALKTKSTGKDDGVRIDCDLTLSPDDVIPHRLEFAGDAASGVTVNCRGATIGTAATRTSNSKPTIAVRSLLDKATGSWSVPRDISIRNCKVRGNVRMIGLGLNGEAEYVRVSSLNRNHTQNAQANAPSGIQLQNLTIDANGDIPLYFGPGVTNSTITKSRFQGKTNKTAIYLDAESAGNTISGNTFSLKTGREVIAVDGSAKNQIVDNEFRNPVDGGIYVYRNCGEGGTIRHQEPQHNLIAGNTFSYKDGFARPAIWLNMRDIGKLYCVKDPKHPFGSSLDPSDQAKFNVVRDNRFKGLWTPGIVNFDNTNQISGNR